ncbi:hypothetical protein AB0D57_02885 [Streptomyces sp. NPDC048275]|uniref:hypothetical protein n=1 Tax=Streptomyces sp. NPDC048275 TaxID=3155629 RepID=UPI00340A35BA
MRRLEALRQEWDRLPADHPECVIHGDAWGGNCAVTRKAVLLPAQGRQNARRSPLPLHAPVAQP